MGEGEQRIPQPKGMLRRIGAKIEEIQKNHTVENIDPSNRLLKIIPDIIPEHLARYEYVSKFIKEQGIDRPLNVLDAASGRGYGSKLLKETLPTGSKVVGVELKMPYARKAVEKYNPKNTTPLSPDYIQGDVKHLPVADNSMDVVSAFEITEHLSKEDQPDFIREIARVLKSGGIGVISVPYPYSLVMNDKGEMVKDMSSNLHHLHEPSREEMISIITKAGLNVKAEMGQALLNKQQADKVRKLSGKIPLWPFYIWSMRRDFSVKPVPNDPNVIPTSHIFAVQKP